MWAGHGSNSGMFKLPRGTVMSSYVILGGVLESKMRLDIIQNVLMFKSNCQISYSLKSKIWNHMEVSKHGTIQSSKPSPAVGCLHSHPILPVMGSTDSKMNSSGDMHKLNCLSSPGIRSKWNFSPRKKTTEIYPSTDQGPYFSLA